MGQRFGLTKAFKKELLSICQNKNQINFINNAFKDNDRKGVDGFVAVGAAEDTTFFGKDLSAEQLLVRLEEVEEKADFDVLIEEVEAFHAYLMTDEGVKKYTDDLFPDLVSQMITALEIAKDHEGAYILLCKDLARMAIPEKFQAMVQKQEKLSCE